MVNLRSMSENQRTAGVVSLKLTHELPKLMSRSEITPKMYNNKKAKPRKKPTKNIKNEKEGIGTILGGGLLCTVVDIIGEDSALCHH